MCAGDAGSVRDKGVWWELWTNGGPRCVMGIQRELRGGAEGWALSELLCLWGALGHQEDPTVQPAPTLRSY